MEGRGEGRGGEGGGRRGGGRERRGKAEIKPVLFSSHRESTFCRQI